MSNYGLPLETFCNKEDLCVELLANHLNNGALSLMLGAGASAGLGLPGWYKLVTECALAIIPGYVLKSEYTNEELKRLMDEVKKIAKSDYIEVIRQQLYQDVEFDFSLAKKDLLIALTSLMIGKSRGNVKQVITYNFDDVLEWYLKINGLQVNVTTFESLLFSSPDVDVIHLHGFVPKTDDYGNISTDIVFTKKEFEDRQVGKSYWKEMMYDFFRKNVFLTVGLSPTSLRDDICPYLRYLNTWYKSENIKRGHPYGIAFITPGKESLDSLNDLMEDGIIPCIIEKDKFPYAIFNIAKAALNRD